MLTLTRRRGERLNIGLNVEVTVLDIGGGRVRLGVEAPRRMQVHRGEVVDRMEVVNRSALLERHATAKATGSALHFPDGLIGLRQYEKMMLCEAIDLPGMHVLVAAEDPCIQLLLVEARSVLPSYPVLDAQRAAGFLEEQAAVALVVTLTAIDKGWANSQAPVVIGVDSRHGRQVILFRDDLPLRCPVELTQLVEGDGAAWVADAV